MTIFQFLGTAMSQQTKFNLGGWIRAVDQLPTLADADDAGNVFQSFKSEAGFNFLSDCHFSMFRFLKDRKNLDGNEYWHPKPRAPKLPELLISISPENRNSELKAGDYVVFVEKLMPGSVEKIDEILDVGEPTGKVVRIGSMNMDVESFRKAEAEEIKLNRRLNIFVG